MKAQEGAGRLINCFAQKTEQGARYPVIWRRCAGMLQLLDISAHVHLRGAVFIDDTMITVLDTRVYAVSETLGLFSAVNLGALAGTDLVTIARNNATVPNIVCVTSAGAFNLFIGSAPTNFADADLPQPNSVSVLDGYLLFTIGDGRIFASGLNNVSIATNSFTTAQRRPGGLLRGVSFRGEFFAFGPNGCEVYRDAGTSPFPLEFVTVIPRGIAGTHAIAGWEDGWSNQLIWVAEDAVVYKLSGYDPLPISNDDVSRAIATAIKAGQGSSLEACVYMQGVHAFWRLTNPGMWTWEYNTTTQNWHERKSYGRTDCRSSVTVKAFNRWVGGDRTTGTLFEISDTWYREAVDSLPFIIRSGVAASFPSRMQIPRMDFDFTAGTGQAAGDDPIQTDPTVLIRWSRNGGGDFGAPVPRKLGRQGEYDNRVTVLRGPMTGPKGVVVELEVDDPVHCGFMGGTFAGMTLAE